MSTEYWSGKKGTPWRRHNSDRRTMMSEATVMIKPAGVLDQQHAANTWSRGHVA